MHLLLRLLNDTKYTGSVNQSSSTRNDERILQIQEPVGYLFFMHDNISRIITRLQKHLQEVNNYTEVNNDDVIDYMMTIFYQHGSSKSGIRVSNDQDARVISAKLSTQTVNELTHRYVDEAALHSEYRGVLRAPNRVGLLPRQTSIRSRGKQNKRYDTTGLLENNLDY